MHARLQASVTKQKSNNNSSFTEYENKIGINVLSRDRNSDEIYCLLRPGDDKYEDQLFIEKTEMNHYIALKVKC